MALNAGQAAVIAALRHAGYPINRENYIAFNWDVVPDPWTAEDEDELPEFLQTNYGVEDAGPPDEPRDETGKWTFGQPVARRPAAERPPAIGGSGGEGETHQGLPVRETRADPKRIAAASAQLKRWKVKELTSVLHKSFGKGGEYFAREWAIAEPDGSYTSVRMRGDGKVNVGQPSTVGFYPDPKRETARLSDEDDAGPT